MYILIYTYIYRSDDNPDFENEMICFDLLDPYQYVMDGDVQMVIEVWNKVWDIFVNLHVYISMFIFMCFDLLDPYQYVMDENVQMVIKIWSKRIIPNSHMCRVISEMSSWVCAV
jgi:hypothetical protein